MFAEPKTTRTFFTASGPVNEVKTNVTIVLMMPAAREIPTATVIPAEVSVRYLLD